MHVGEGRVCHAWIVFEGEEGAIEAFEARLSVMMRMRGRPVLIATAQHTWFVPTGRAFDRMPRVRFYICNSNKK